MQKMVNVCCPLGCSDNRAIQEQLPGSSWANLKPKLTKKIKQTAEDKLIKTVRIAVVLALVLNLSLLWAKQNKTKQDKC